MWAFARIHLGLTSDEFWDMSPPEFGALTMALWRKQKSELRGAAMVCSVLINLHGGNITADEILGDDEARDWEAEAKEAFKRAREEDERCKREQEVADGNAS